MEPKWWSVPEGVAGQRVDKWLAGQLPGISRSRIQGWIDEGRVSDDDGTLVRNSPLRPGTRIRLLPPEEASPDTFQPSPVPLTVLHEDEALVVIDKAPTQVVHPGAGTPAGSTLVEGLVHRFGFSGEIDDPTRPGVVHRLDRGTSGLLVWTRTIEAQRHLAAQFKARKVTKEYLTVVQGKPRPVTGTIETPIARHPHSRTRMAVRKDGKPAHTDWALMHGGDGWSTLRCQIHTGRTHQIRVHLSSIGLPVAGDRTYGFKPTQWKDHPPPDRPLLHASFLEFVHPTSKLTVSFHAPPPPDMSEYCP